jgi:CheY-like chemotaxis protein
MLFSDYGMIDTKTNRKIEGTGLGLPITKKIAEMMGGSISVESEYKKGSVFTVKVLQQFVSDAVIGPEVVNSLRNFQYSDHKRRRHSGIMRVNLSYARVLLVDDVTTNLDVARGMMKPYGMQIDCVTSGEEAINAVRSEKVKYNAIFMDHMMPGMDGMEATRIIREEIGTEYAKTVPIIALTANAIMGNEAMFLSKGFDAFISKPIEIERLDGVIREWVRDKDLEKGLDLDNVDRKESQSTIPALKIDGLDFDKGLKRFSGNKESYFEVLSSFASNTGMLLEKIKKVDKDNLANYGIVIHGIKGSCLGICANQAGDKAGLLENAAKTGDLNFGKDNNAAFIEGIEKLINDLKEALDTSKPKKNKPDNDVLGRLLTACNAYDMDGIDSAMEEIELCEYEADDGLAIWLRENVDKMNFSQIKERLSLLSDLSS